MMPLSRTGAAIGAGFALIAVVLTATTDTLTKLLSHDFPMPQVVFVSALISTAGSWTIGRGMPDGVRTAFPLAMAWRSVATIAATACYFVALRRLQLTEVFVFTALMPVFAGLLSAPLLREPIAARHWMALLASCLGVILVVPDVGDEISIYYLVALAASFCGALALVLSRRIGRVEHNASAMVFYPQLALMCAMAPFLYHTYRPMAGPDLALTVLFGMTSLFGRLALAEAFSRAPAAVVAPLVNLQFFVLLVLGYIVFGDIPRAGIYPGAAVVVAAGLYLTVSAAGPAPWPGARMDWPR